MPKAQPDQTQAEEAAILRAVGRQVRARRAVAGLTLKQLAEDAGLSARFVSEVEGGAANISVGKLAGLAAALGATVASLVSVGQAETRASIDEMLDRCDAAQLEQLRDLLEVTLGLRAPRIVALLGIRGAGKSTVGPLLAARLGRPFIELDARIEDRAGLSAGDIFSLHGEQHYRALETECLAELIQQGQLSVVALPGGVVANHEALDLVRRSCRSVWLHTTPGEYWRRVFSQGDRRPMAGRASAMADLRALIARRAPLYEQADLSVDTTDRSPAEIADQIATYVQAGCEEQR